MRAYLTQRLSGCIHISAMARNPIYKQIGAVIKGRRKTMGLRQKELAGTLGISRGSLANIEIGRQSVLVHQLYEFAAALKVAPTDLLPQPLPKDSKSAGSRLPLPGDLKAQQREQIARLFDQVDTNQIRRKEGNRGRPTKR